MKACARTFSTTFACVATAISLGTAACSFEPPPYQPLPQVASYGGPVLSHPRVVTITFANDTDAVEVERHAQWMVQSNWIQTVGPEYGVGTGEVIATVRRTENAPGTIEHAEIESFLASELRNGGVPRPADGDVSSVIYMIAYPRGTTVTRAGGSVTATSCQEFYGYHSAIRVDGVEIPYTVAASCAEAFPGLSAREERELVAAHEFFEAATDPFPRTQPALRLGGVATPWIALGAELADLCEAAPNGNAWHEGERVAQRVWSNQAAAAHDRNPCVPAPDHERYYNMSATPSETQFAAPGATIHYTLRPWATDPMFPQVWTLATATTGAFMPFRNLPQTGVGRNQTNALDVTIPRDATVGSAATVLVVSYLSSTDYYVLPLEVVVGEPCHTHTDCASCTTSTGCGWCASSARCELAAQGGSAESACRGNDFGALPGFCPGYCESHGSSCADCADQGGCGWCDSPSGGRCLSSAWNYSGPADGTCSGAAWSFVPAYCPVM